ncbi:hypothetical protein MycrhDRAFT_5721 [Mycolicibacterium rhodesiae JS60]|nr:hypothetical protein MycrhDRAFT_5721 [Mycolicibacterium rhodesiae JS60]
MRRARRQWIVDAGETPPSMPMWTSRDGWLDELAAWADSELGRAERARVNVSLEMLLRVARVLAEHADHGSGRNCAVTNAASARSARCSVRTVRTVRGVLREAKLAVEVRRGTGSAATPAYGRRASVWHLVSRREPVDNSRVCRLPPSRSDRRLAPVGKRSPSSRTRPPTKNSTHRRRHGRARCAPRPLHTQKLAAGVIAGSLGLDAVHPGHICDALDRSGIDVDAWTAPQLLAALNADMRKTGWSWPDHVQRPGAFLASRLRRLPTTPEATSTRILDGRGPATRTEAAPTSLASAGTRAAAMEYFRTHRRGQGMSVAATRLAGKDSEEDS